MTPEEEAVEQLREQTRWLRFLGMQQLRPALETTLKSDTHRLVYELTDGVRTVRQIAKLAGVGAATVSRLWGQWSGLGLVVPSTKATGRWRHLISLSDLGLDVPAVPSKSVPEEPQAGQIPESNQDGNE